MLLNKRNTPKTLVVFTSYPWDSVLVYLRYRAPAEMAGWQVVPGHDGENVFAERVAHADVVVFQRDVSRLTSIYQTALRLSRKYSKRVIYETDDWLLGVPDEHPFQDQYVGVLNWMLASILGADKVITSTEFLQKRLQDFRPDTELWPNYLPDNLWSLRSPQISDVSDSITIGYMGTVTHLPDLQMLLPTLIQILEYFGDRIKMKFWGFRPPEPICQYKNVSWQILDIPRYQDFVSFFMQQSADIWLAPLQDTEFNRCKSAIKFLEYSALGGAGVYSRVKPYEKLVVDGKNGYLADTQESWYKALSDLIDNPEKRNSVAIEAQKTLQRDWLLSNHIEEWEKLFLNFRETDIFRVPDEQIKALEEIARQVSKYLNKPEVSNEQLNQILASRSWRLITKAQRIRENLIPLGSKREKIAKQSLHSFRKLTRYKASKSMTSLESRNAIIHYQNWLSKNEPDSDELGFQRKQIAKFSYQPLVSIITPVFNPEPEHLVAMIHSVLNQTYPNWELCLADGNPSNTRTRSIIEKAVQSDERIKVLFLDENRGISENSNAALSLAQGEFIAFLDHDDLLAPFALFELVRTLNHDRNLDLVYSDHDLVTENGQQRFSPLFKPDWSPEIMLSANYITHLTVVRRSLVDRVGGFRKEFDGAQDWDLFLRVAELSDKIGHIPKILYHWRDTPSSTARNIHKKDYAPQAQLQAIGAHLDRQGLSSPDAFFDPSGFIRVKWRLEYEPKVSIIIPSYGVNHLLKKCIASITEKTCYSNYEVVVVNNGPKRPTEFTYYQQLTNDQRFQVIHDERHPFNYSAVNNFGASYASGEVLVFLNNDTEILSEDWLDEIVMWTSRPEIGVVGAKLLMPDYTIQHAGVILGLTGFAGHIFAGMPEGQNTIFGLSEWYRNYLAMTAACFAVKRSVFENLGGLNEKLVLCGNDVEFCFRVRDAGYRNLYNPFVKLMHEESATREGTIPAGDYRESYICYRPFLQAGDPYFNPNLSMWKLIPELRSSSEASPDEFAIELLRNLDA